MQLYFFGAGKVGRKALSRCKDYDNSYTISLVDNKLKGRMDDIPIIPLNEVPINGIVVITVYAPKIIKDIYMQLKNANYQNIYVYLEHTIRNESGDFLTDECVCANDWGECILPQAEMHITDWCNMNCQGCTHFSPIFEKNFPNIEERVKDVQKLKSKFSHIIRFYMLGGEPFLNPELGQYIVKIKQVLSTTDLWIVTNGILILKVEDGILDIIRDNGVTVSISEYEPIHKIIDVVLKRLKDHQIKYNVRAYDSKQKFNLPLTLSSESRHKQLCISNGCVNIYNGKISRCPTLMYIDEFNNKFGTNLPNDGIMSLDEDMNGEQLLQKLSEEVPLCKHCVENEIKWEQCGKEVLLSDFAILD